MRAFLAFCRHGSVLRFYSGLQLGLSSTRYGIRIRAAWFRGGGRGQCGALAVSQTHREKEPGSNLHTALEQSVYVLVGCRLVVHAGVKKQCSDALLL
jgi:hypothetical protein